MTSPTGEPATASPAAPDPATAENTAQAEAALPGEVPLYTAPNRPRGLNAYFAPGGDDAATEDRRADERRNLRLLLLMVAALVLIPTLLTIVALFQNLISRGGG